MRLLPALGLARCSLASSSRHLLLARPSIASEASCTSTLASCNEFVRPHSQSQCQTNRRAPLHTSAIGDEEGEIIDSDSDLTSDIPIDIDPISVKRPPPQKPDARLKKRLEAIVPDSTQLVSHLPDSDLWPKLFQKVESRAKLQSDRWFLANPTTCDDVISALQLDQKSDKHTPTTVIEGYPGPGIMTSAFLKAKGVDKVVAMENNMLFQKGLQNLQKSSNDAAQRLSLIDESAYDWTSYSTLLDKGHLDHIPFIRHARTQKPDYSQGYFNDEMWKQPSPLLFFAQLPSTVHSEQLLSQLTRAIAHRQWLFRFGRVRMAFLCSEQVAQRCIAPPGDRLRGKFTYIVSAMADVKIVRTSETFEPSVDHVYPKQINVGSTLPYTKHRGSIKSQYRSVEDKESRKRLCLIVFQPKVEPLIRGDEMDMYDYVTKHLMILRSSQIGKAMQHLGGGAESILRRLNNTEKGPHPVLKHIREPTTIDTQLKPSELSAAQMVAITLVFDRWPFKPENILDDISIQRPEFAKI